MSKKKSNIEVIKQELNAGNESLNIQIGAVNIITSKDEIIIPSVNKEIIIPVELSDMIYKGSPNNWINVVDFYKRITKRDILQPNELLRLLVSYDIGRIRKLEDAKNEILFLDTSWLSHNYSHWNKDADMSRWLMNLTEVTKIRATKSLKTSRVFFWKPKDVTTHSVLFEIIKTISVHLSFGIKVYLAEATDIVHPIDFQLFGKAEGIIASDFVNYNFEQKNKVSDSELATELFEVVKDNIDNDRTIEFSINDRLFDIRKKIESKCSLN